MSMYGGSYRFSGTGPDEYYYRALESGNRQAYLSSYDRHNGQSRTSKDVNERIFGKCGCGYCVTVREREQFGDRAMNQQGRQGSSSMSSVNICDRCGSLVKGLALGQVFITTSSDVDVVERVAKEICPGCVETILAIIENPGEQKQQAYQEPYKRPEKGSPGLGELDGVALETLLAEALQRAMKANKALEAGRTVEGDVE